MKNIGIFIWKLSVQVLVVKNAMYLNRHVFVMHVRTRDHWFYVFLLQYAPKEYSDPAALRSSLIRAFAGCSVGSQSGPTLLDLRQITSDMILIFSVRPAKIQISLRNSIVWSDTSQGKILIVEEAYFCSINFCKVLLIARRDLHYPTYDRSLILCFSSSVCPLAKTQISLRIRTV